MGRLRDLPTHGVTAAQLVVGMVKAFLCEPGSLSQLSKKVSRRSSGIGADRRLSDVIPIPMPTLVRYAIHDRDHPTAAMALMDSRGAMLNPPPRFQSLSLFGPGRAHNAPGEKRYKL